MKRFLMRLFSVSGLLSKPVTALAAGVISWGITALDSSELDCNDFVAISATGSYNLSLKPGGSIVGWGNNDCNQAISPDGNNLVAVAAGSWHSLAQKPDGSIIGWGWNDSGQSIPVGHDSFITMSAGGYHSLAMSSKFNLAGDINCDCKVDLCNLALMAGNWLINCNTNPNHPVCIPKID